MVNLIHGFYLRLQLIRLNKLLLIAIFFILYYVFFVLHAKALAQSLFPQAPLKEVQSGFSLSIYPPVTWLTIQPGQGTNINVKVTNSGDPLVVETNLVPFVAADEGGGVKLIECPKIKIALCQALQWFSMENSFFLRSKETKTFPLALFIPKNTMAGDYTFTLLFSSTPQLANETIVSQLVGQIGTNIIITVAADNKLEKSGRVVTFSPVGGINLKLGRWSLKLFDIFDEIPLILRVHNSGKTLIQPAGEIALTSSFWPTVVFPINPQYVLADTIRTMIADSATSGNRANNQQRVYSLHLPSSLYLGRYQATANLSLFPGQPALVLTTIFWAVPLRLTILIIFLTLFIWFGKRYQFFKKIQSIRQKKWLLGEKRNNV